MQEKQAAADLKDFDEREPALLTSNQWTLEYFFQDLKTKKRILVVRPE